MNGVIEELIGTIPSIDGCATQGCTSKATTGRLCTYHAAEAREEEREAWRMRQNK